MKLVRPVRSIPAILVLVAALAVMLCACSKKKEEPKQEEQGAQNITIERYSKVPDLVLRRLDGAVDRLSYYQGKIVVLSLWATWNKDSKREVAELNELYPTLRGTPVVMLGVVIDKNGEEALRKFLQNYPVPYTVYYNGQEIAGQLGGVSNLPTTYVLLRDASVYEKVVGYQPGRYFRDMLDDIKRMRM